MPFWRHLSRTLLALAALASWALTPAVADAATLDTVQSAVGAVTAPVQAPGEEAAGVVRPVVEPVSPSDPVTSPADSAGEDPIDETVAPIARGAAAAVPSRAATVPRPRLQEPAKAGRSRISASASAERSGGRAEREQGSGGVAGRHPSPQRRVTANGSAKEASSAAEEAQKAAAQPLALAPEPGSGTMAAADGSGAFTGAFFFGGGFALLVAWILLAGPRLRRGFSMLPAVCRPAAFLVVLERPG